MRQSKTNRYPGVLLGLHPDLICYVTGWSQGFMCHFIGVWGCHSYVSEAIFEAATIPTFPQKLYIPAWRVVINTAIECSSTPTTHHAGRNI